MSLQRVLIAGLVAWAACKDTVQPPDIEKVTGAEADTFARAFEQAVAKCDRQIDAMIDLETMMKIGLTGESAPKVRTVDGEPRPVFRILVADGGFNYQEMRLGRVAGDKDVKAVDIYVYSSGENLSATLLDLFRGAMKSMDKDSAFTSRLTMTQVREAMTSGDYARAKQQLQELPASFRATKAVRMFEVQIQMHLDEKEYIARIDRFRHDFPNDASIDMIALDGYILKKEWASARAAIERIDTRVGGDPYLDVMRSRMSAAAGNAADAVKEATTKREPTIQDAWLALVDADAAANDHAGAIAALDTLRAKFAFEIDEATMTAPSLAALRASPESQRWKTGGPARSRP